MRGWLGRFRGLGQAFLELLRAEVEALAADLRRSARELRAGVVLLLAAAFVAFWALGALVYLAVEVAALWLPRWGAVASVLGVLVLAALCLLAVARSRLRRIEAPARTVRRHVEDHVGWFQDNVLPPGEEGSGGPEGGGASG